MNLEHAIAAFGDIPPAQQIRVLARYAHSVTIAARGTYEAGTVHVLDPGRLRELNEVQHRVLGQLISLICDSPGYTDDLLVRIVVREDDEELLSLFFQALEETH